MAWARCQRLKELNMWCILREGLLYFSFLVILCLITYPSRTQDSFLQVKHLERHFTERNPDYLKVSIDCVRFSVERTSLAM